MEARLIFGFESTQVPMIYQAEAAECGLASLAMIAGRYGSQYDLRSLRGQFPAFLRGARLTQLIECADKLKMIARPLRLEVGEVQMLKTPCILHWDLNHFVVLVKTGTNRVYIHDPASGRRCMKIDEFAKHFTGIALEVIPALDFQPNKIATTVSLSNILGKMVGWKRSMILIFAMAFALEVLGLMGPMFNQWVVDEVISSGNVELLNVLVLGSGLLLVSQVVIGLTRSWAVLYMSTNFGIQWSSNVFGHLLRLPLAWFERRHLGDIVSRVSSVHTIQRTLTTGFIEASIDGLFATVTLLMMFIYNSQLSCVVICSVICYGALRFVSYGPIKAANEESLSLEAKENSFFLESVRGIQAIKLFGKESERRSRWLSLVADVTNRALRTERFVLGFDLLNTAVAGGQMLLMFWLGANLVIDGRLTIGALFAFTAYGATFSARAISLVNQISEFRMLSLHSSRLADVVLEPPERRPPDGVPATQHAARIEFSDVSFRYDESTPWLLRHANLVIEPGESVVIVGPSGCGKTTLVKLLLGVLQPCEGEVRFGGVPIHKLSANSYAQAFGSVMQEDHLFSGSLAENISFFDSTIDYCRVIECSKIASVHNDIEALPMGYQTLVGDMGATLSGGQKQRILLARAFYKRPRALILDEATSHLDIAKEREVNSFIKTLLISRISVAHRPETIAMADRLIEIVASGGLREVDVEARPNAVHNELFQDNGDNS